ncbi:MAG TPA: hypothetical protein VE993_02970 [Stellaceae bacterium]|nr:hypothetical protein [Stellaceae bacterium]
MHIVLAVLAAGLLLAGGPASATPHFAMSNQTELGAAASLHLVRGGCGLGFHRQGWRDRYGRWHVRCVPNR